MTADQLILNRLDSIEGLLRKLINPMPQVALTENDFTRAERAALDARDKSKKRREFRKAGQA